MADTGSQTARVRDGADAFAALVLRYLDGLTTADEVARLNAALLSGRPYRELFVHLCRLDGLLCETFVPLSLSVEGREKGAPRARAGRQKNQAGAAHGKVTAHGTATGVDQPPAPRKGKAGAATRNTKLLAGETAFPETATQGQNPPASAGPGTAEDQPDDLLRLLGLPVEESDRTE